MNYKNILKAFLLHIDVKNKKGVGLNVIYVQKVSWTEFKLVATTGESLLLGTFKKEDWDEFRRIVPMMPEVIITGHIEDNVFMAEDTREYPLYEKSLFTEAENPMDQFPVFGFDVYAIAGKTFKLLGFNFKFFMPDVWKGIVSPAIKYFDNYTLLLMPYRRESVR